MSLAETEQKVERVPIYKKQCPVCNRPSIYARSVAETEDLSESGLWYSCVCGVIFQKELPESKLKNQSHIDSYYDKKEFNLIGHYAAKLYAPIIEELTYGRKLLDVGFSTPENMNYFKKRGWITFGMDNNKDIVETDRIFNDDFETTDKLYAGVYDCVWMSHVLENFKNPVGAMAKARDVLAEDGTLYISTPDSDFLYSKDLAHWSYWKRKEHYVYWNERSLCRELEKLGFNIIYKKRNYYQRFGYYNDLHIIAQKIIY